MLGAAAGTAGFKGNPAGREGLPLLLLLLLLVPGAAECPPLFWGLSDSLTFSGGVD